MDHKQKPMTERERQRKQRLELSRRVGEKEARKIWAREHKNRSVWFGLGMFGLIGWSVAVPVVAGIALGMWLDATWPSRFSWTLTLLFIGFVLGCLNAWHWLTREREKIEQEKIHFEEDMKSDKDQNDD